MSRWRSLHQRRNGLVQWATMPSALAGKVAVITGGTRWNRPGHRHALRRRGRPGVHHRAPPGRAGQCDCVDRRRGDGVCRRRHQHQRLERAVRRGREQAGRIDVKGTLLTVQGALTLLVDGASVILMSSTTSALGGASFSVYAASKAAVRNFARSWALDLKARSIRVDALAPGPTHTPGLVGLAPEDHARACSTASPKRSRWRASPTRTRSPAQRSSSRHRTRASSTASSCSPTGAKRRCSARGAAPSRSPGTGLRDGQRRSDAGAPGGTRRAWAAEGLRWSVRDPACTTQALRSASPFAAWRRHVRVSSHE